MANSKTLFDRIISDLKLEESIEEINALAFAVLSYVGISRTDVLSAKAVDVAYDKIGPIISRLNRHEPLQYIFNEAWFCGHRFFVDSSVLIPRPETELLVEEASKFLSYKKSPHVLDIGTGSGCIAISIALQFPQANIVGIDISEEALAVARKNSIDLKANVQFLRHDILNNKLPGQKFDLILSNPPYISWQEKSSLAKNVIEHEPHLALFADEHDPLIFYRAIANLSNLNVSPEGSVMVEINERFGKDVCDIFQLAGLKNIEAIKDFSGKNRIVVGQKGL